MQIKKTGQVNVPPKILIYGPEGVGKSTFGALAPNPIFIQTEDGLDYIETSALPLVESWDIFQEQLEYVQSEEAAEFKTVVIDSVDWLERLVHNEVASKAGVTKIEEIGYGKGFLTAGEMLQVVPNDETIELRPIEHPGDLLWQVRQGRLHRRPGHRIERRPQAKHWAPPGERLIGGARVDRDTEARPGDGLLERAADHPRPPERPTRPAAQRMRPHADVDAFWCRRFNRLHQLAGMRDFTVGQLRVSGHLEQHEDIAFGAPLYRRHVAPHGFQPLRTGGISVVSQIVNPGDGVIESLMVDLRIVEAVEEAPLHYQHRVLGLVKLADDVLPLSMRPVPDERYISHRGTRGAFAYREN